MTRYAVVDLEATDAHSSENKIIQIGIVIVENDEIVETYETDVNPHEPLMPRIKELTGLSNNRLKQAPDFSEVAQDIHKMLENTVFVAHNAKFDYGLLWKSLAQLGLDIDLTRIDTVDLSRVFYPTFEKYGLESLSDWLDLSHEHPHAAVSDAYATAELLVKIQQKVRQLPRAVLEELLRHADNLLYETKSFLQEQLAQTQLQVDGLSVVHNIATKSLTNDENLSKKVLTELSKNFDENIKTLGLSSREKQAQLAEIITDELTGKLPTFIEAPTGIGKTYGYLLPLLAAGKRIIVSTTTKVLQNQLVQDVAPILDEKFGIKMSKLLGLSNYISLEKFSQILQNNTDGKNFEIFKMKVLVWLTETETGELDELSRVMTNDDYFARLAYGGYLGASQLHYEQEFWLRAQKRSKISEISVVNHAYLIERLADYPETFLENRVLVVDEAQQLFPIMENLGQQSIKITDELVKIDTTGSQLTKRLQESLIFQLSKKQLDLDKIRLDAEELGLTELSKIVSVPDSFVWRENDRLFSSQKDFYNFAQRVPKTSKLFMLGATLSLSDEKPTFPELLGFDDYQFFKIKGNVAENQQLFVINDGPNVKNTGTIDYAHYTAEAVAELAELNIPIVVLFTSKISLTFTAEKLSADGWTVLAQDINGTATQIKKKFDKGESQILLGLGSFWEGVDFEQQDKLILVISRLPFSTPDDILTKKYASKFKNPFYDFNVPMATLKMRQALGRVNRRTTQRSSVVVLDNRLLGKSYAKRMRHKLTDIISLKKLGFEETVSEILNFLL
ncbi:helicase C-terminal domain-containing protein [Lactococcus nasutitermitis]|uniref:3'-5' exonuclease DinG n=1 Tax=Lactococcus nasutitermitis TaxID=1652957 RepID=A0ABV9JCW7_9LACT|nr:helicase C-terminal domain-containing protein [Lactococcus nasutitermitis]